MEEKTKPKDISGEDKEKLDAECLPGSFIDQKEEGSYYYDDAHGYETFVEETDDEED